MPRRSGAGSQRAAIRLDCRSVYLMRGPSRDDWEHSIPAVEALRYSVTFRSLRVSDPCYSEDRELAMCFRKIAKSLVVGWAERSKAHADFITATTWARRFAP